MASSATLHSISNILECKICLQPLRDPKTLPCHHLFCKECLEGILQFQDDGSIDIPCPNRCPNPMHLEKDETLDKLGASFEIKAILETLKTQGTSAAAVESKSNSWYGGKKEEGGCEKEVIVHCCGDTMCRKCYEEHLSSKNELNKGKCVGQKTDVTVDRDSGDLSVICPIHSTKCTYVCQENHGLPRKSFLCVYCLNRNHKGHRNDQIDTAALKLKETLRKGRERNEVLESIHKATEESFSELKKKMHGFLLHRKWKKLVEYMEMLNANELRLRGHLDSLCKEHMKRFPKQFPPEYFDELLSKQNTELLLCENDLKCTVEKDLRFPALHLSLLPGSLWGNQPLGYIVSKRKLGRTEWKDLPTFPKFVTPEGEEDLIAIECDDDNQFKDVTRLIMVSEFAKYLKDDETTKSSYSCELDSGCSCCSLTQDLKSVSELGLSFLEELIKLNEIPRLGAVLAARPSLLDLRGMDNDVFDYTLLHYATGQGGTEMVKMLCQHFPCLMEKKSRFGYTPLHCVAARSRPAMLRTLLGCGADPSARNTHGRTPLEEAVMEGDKECVQELRKWENRVLGIISN